MTILISRRSLALVVIILVLLGTVLALGSCRPATPPGQDGHGDDGNGGNGGNGGTGDGGGDLGGVWTAIDAPAGLGASLPAARVMEDITGHRAVAIGPFQDLREWGAVAGTDLAWGWGTLADGRVVFLMVDQQGTVRAAEVPAKDNVGMVYPLPWAASGAPAGSGAGGAADGVVVVRYSDFTAAFYPISGEVRELGPGNSVQISPSGARLLVFGENDSRCWTLDRWETTPQPNLPAIGFPYSGSGVGWVTDSLATARFWEPNGGPLGLAPDAGIVRLVSEPDGLVVGDLSVPGDALSTFASPGGDYLAVLHVSAATAVLLPECLFPADFGQSLDIYRVSDLVAAAGGDLSRVKPVATYAAPQAKFITNIKWSPDDQALAFSLTDYGPSMDIPDPSDSNRSVLHVAAAPAFQFSDAGLPGGDWVPVAFSPDATRLVAANNMALGGYIWDIAAKSGVTLPARADAVSPSSLVWIDDKVLLGALTPGYEDSQPVLVRASDGGVTDPGWAHAPWFGVAADGVAARASLQADGTVAPFGTVGAGQWLVYYPVPDGAR